MIRFSLRSKVLIPVIILMVAIIVVLASSEQKPIAEKPVVGGKAPDFILKDLNQRELHLSEVYKNNRVTVLNFWATWCPPCRSEIPEFIDFYRQYQGERLELLAVNLRESSEKVRAFYDAQGINFPVLLDESGKVSNVYEVQAIPTTFFIDENGIIRELIKGSISKAELVRIMDKILEEK